jgi:hypothetical protein
VTISIDDDRRGLAGMTDLVVQAFGVACVTFSVYYLTFTATVIPAKPRSRDDAE